MALVPIDKDESKCYSRDERQHFRQVLLQDIRRMQDLLHSTPPDMVTQDDLVHAIGIETFLSPDLAQHILRKKHAHVAAVLSAQNSGYNNEQLSLVSQRSSSWARERAQKLADGYAKQLQS